MLPAWISVGLAFQCQRCTRCCRGAGEIRLGPDEATRLAQHLQLPVALFRARYIRRPGSLVMDIDVGRDCPFLEGTACRVEPVKPRQCRAWPFFPANLASAQAWERTAAVCPGVGKGKLWTEQEVAAACAEFQALYG